MARKIYQKTTINQTGEIIENTWITSHKDLDHPSFIKMMFNEIGFLAKCNKAEQAVVLCCTKWIEFDTNELVLTSARRKELCECGGLAMATVNMAVSRLYKKNIFIRDKDTKKTFLNPSLFFYGKDIKAGNIIRLVREYRLV